MPWRCTRSAAGDVMAGATEQEQRDQMHDLVEYLKSR